MTLCVSSYQLGAPFVDKHVTGIRPGDTVVILQQSEAVFGRELVPAPPRLCLDKWSSAITTRALRKAGFDIPSLRGASIGRFLKRHRVDVVLGNFLDQFLDVLPAVERLGLPYVVQGHGVDVSAALRDPTTRAAYQAYRSANAILTRSELHRRRLIELGLPEGKVHVNPGGVEIPDAMPQKSGDASRRVLAIGRMVPQKAPIMLLEAFRRAVSREPDLTLDYVGDGPLLPAARQFVEACDLTHRVKLHGLVPDGVRNRLLMECGLFVQHSVTVRETGNEEGLPAAIQEAMAHGLAVVSTRHAGIPDCVVEGETGLLVDEGDVAGMAEAIIEALRHAGFGRAGYDRAKGFYGWEHERGRLMQWLSP